MRADLVERVRHRLASGGAEVTAASVAAAVRTEMGGVAAHEDVLSAVRQLRGEFIGVGPLEALVGRDDVTDVLVTGPEQVWVDGAEGLQRSSVTFPDDAASGGWRNGWRWRRGGVWTMRNLASTGGFRATVRTAGSASMRCCRRSPPMAPASRCACCVRRAMT